MLQIQNLLTHIKFLVDKNNELESATSGKFNIFKVIGVNYYETIHSAILAEFLNPHGSHGFKDVFIKTFLEIVHIPNFLNTATVKVKTEAKTDDGRIDIFLTDTNGKALIIENKIYAGDQREQLKRYEAFATEKLKKGNFKILYLTLWGIDASEQSGKGVDYSTISYKDEIISWLELCQIKAINRPLVRESLEQYIQLLKSLTNQNMSDKLTNDIVDIVLHSNENLETALLLEGSLNAIKTKLQELFWNSLEESLKTKLPNAIITSNYQEKLIGYYYKSSKEYKLGGISIELLRISPTEVLQFVIMVDWNIYYGIRILNDTHSDKNTDAVYKKYILEKMLDKSTHNQNWLGWKYPNQKIDFTRFTSDNDILYKLAEKKTRKEQINSLSDEIISFINQYMDGLKQVL